MIKEIKEEWDNGNLSSITILDSPIEEETPLGLDYKELGPKTDRIILISILVLCILSTTLSMITWCVS